MGVKILSSRRGGTRDTPSNLVMNALYTQYDVIKEVAS
jgi:hypothetical protein